MMSYFLTLAGLLFVYMNVWFFISLIKKRNDVADIAWGLGFVFLSWISFFVSEASSVLGGLVSSLVTIWGFRLAWHIYSRNKRKSEDARYKKWRDDWGKWFVVRSYLQIYMLQGILLYIIVFPVLLINFTKGISWSVISILGLLVWIFGFAFETIADWQLKNFLQNPKNSGKLMQSGLWAYTRHPNYFGEVSCWWGIWLLALFVPWGWLSVISPLLITFLIVRVSGIPLLEQKMADHPDFAEYKRRVSRFFPLPPKN